MFKIKWDKKNNYIKLVENVTPAKEIIPPRLVYFEELDLLGFDKLYKYPKSDEPLLWSIGRSYYYRGEKIAEANGGGFNEKPKMNFIFTCNIIPININAMIKANEENLTVLINEAKTYINEIYKKYKQSHSISTAFSGGKDSQVVLDLVSQVIPPEDYFAIFTDTQMELPDTYNTVTKTFNTYKNQYDGFTHFTAHQFRPILDNWEDFGPPSRLHRWCCTVCKTSPYIYEIKKHIKENKSLIVFEGIRKAESNNRSHYERFADGVKHDSITNVRPILNWNNTEIYVYLLFRKININRAYRYGLQRVGCAVCPFSSEWSEFIISHVYPNITNKFFLKIRNSIKNIGIDDSNKIEEYIKKGNWKKRGGGKNLSAIKSNIDINIVNNNLTIDIEYPRSDIFQWIKVIKPYNISNSLNSFTIETKFKGLVKIINISIKDNKINIFFKFSKSNDSFISIIKRIAYKTTFCSLCNVCVSECPTNAISMTDGVLINDSLCIGCLKCLKVADKGCLIAKSRTQNKGANIMNKKKTSFDKYSTFGLREEWLISYLKNPSNWKDTLGSKQIPALRNWLIEAGLMTINKEVTHSYHLLADMELSLIWQIIWVNLCHNSNVINWYSKLDYNFWERTLIHEKIFTDYPEYSEGTLKNPISAMINTFNHSHILQNNMQIGELSKKGNAIIGINKIGSNDISPTSLIYSIYKFAEFHGFHDTTLTELYKENMVLTPYRIFGIESNHLKQALVSLQDNKYRIVRIEFSANLENIYLNKDLSANDVLEIMLTGDLK